MNAESQANQEPLKRAPFPCRVMRGHSGLHAPWLRAFSTLSGEFRLSLRLVESAVINVQAEVQAARELDMADIPTFAAFSLAALFGAIGGVQLAGPRFVRDAYRNWDYSQCLRVVMGLLDVATAIMLAEASLRGWGIALAAILTFGSVVTLLNHGQYAYAAAAMLMMAALVPATLAIPRANQVRFIETPPPLFADTR